jgi:hypothetical protein
MIRTRSLLVTGASSGLILAASRLPHGVSASGAATKESSASTGLLSAPTTNFA